MHFLITSKKLRKVLITGGYILAVKNTFNMTRHKLNCVISYTSVLDYDIISVQSLNGIIK